MEHIGGAPWQYAWLPTGAVQALVCWLAATLLRPPGKFAQAVPYFCRGRQAIDEELKRHNIGMQVLHCSPALFSGLSYLLLQTAKERNGCILHAVCGVPLCRVLGLVPC